MTYSGPPMQPGPPGHYPYAQYQPHQPPPASGGGAVLGLGIASLVVGVIGAMGAWVPFCGLIWAIPIATIGAVLGLLGGILALTSGAPRKPSPVLPVVGLAVSVLAIVGSIWVTRAAAQRAAKIAEERRQQAQAEVQRMQAVAEKSRRDAATRPALPAPPPEPGLVRGRITMRQYNGLFEGTTTYSQVVATFGAEGVATDAPEGSPTGTAAGGIKIYTWNDRFGGVVTCTFRDNKLASKSQRGLR